MTRVSTLGQNQLMLRNILQTQERLFDLQRQAASGDKFGDFKGLNTDTVLLTAAQTRLARAEQFQDNITQAKTKLDLRVQVIDEISTIAQELKATYLQAESIEDGTQLRVQSENIIQRVTALLNTRDQNGNFLFGGSRVDTPPVALTPNGAPPPAFTINFQNDTIKETINLDDGLTLDIGVLADDSPNAPSGPFQPLLDLLNHFAAGFYPPPFAANQLPPVTPNPVTAEQVVPLIDQAFQTINNLHADLGIKQNIIDEADKRLEVDINITTAFIAEVKDADIADVVVRLNQEQVALEATLQVTADLAGLNLVNFL